MNTHLRMHGYTYILQRIILEYKYYYNVSKCSRGDNFAFDIRIVHRIWTIITGWYYTTDSYIIDSMDYIETILNVMKYSKRMGILTSNTNCLHSNNNTRIAYPHLERKRIIS